MTGTPSTAHGSANSPNFGHLARDYPLLAHHGAKAERYVFDDPTVAIFKLRRFGEALAQQVAAMLGLRLDPQAQQLEVLRALQDRTAIEYEVAELFHLLRKEGNEAVHHDRGTQRSALHLLRTAWRLGNWFQQAFRDRSFRAGPFMPPPDPREADQALRMELAALRQGYADAVARAQQVEASAAELASWRETAEAEISKAYEELEVALEIAAESEARTAQLEAEFKAAVSALQVQQAAAPKADVDALLKQSHEASATLDLDESETRQLIDAQLRDYGWEADSVAMTYANGVKPAKGRNMAIAEWPVGTGRADYVLFIGLTPVGVIEAKRQCKNVQAAIEQAARYSKGYVFTGEPMPGSAPYGAFNLPFLFATNGRPFLRQLRTQSGIWFRDARRLTNHAVPLPTWYSPNGLLGLLEQDLDLAEQRLETESADYLPLRDYQRGALVAVEEALADGKREMLVAMATGTGKTRTALCMIYRLLKARRFRRILFLVDRTALGEQAFDAFGHVRLENRQSLTEIYGVKTLGDLSPEPDTRLHVATVQGMVKRLVYPSEGAEPIPVDWYDCIVVDECHRGYNLDRDMSDGELNFRSEQEYISKYRRVLDHFDAVRIGLTATPALHTTEIFGKPVYEYSYPQAVIDGFLVDHEPPIRIVTELNEDGIHWGSGERLNVYNTLSGQLQLFETPDEIDIEVEGFNTRVITENFNRVVCEQLAEQIDPSLPGKTLIFCATDAHADMVVDLLKQVFASRYGSVEDAAVQKITGAADKPLDKIRHYKNEPQPSVAVTVDLLTTGIDVPEICNLVFLRRVRSRILYDQMLGRATRLCDAIGKEFFRIFDAVDIYDALEPVSAMKPVVTRPQLAFEDLVKELLEVGDNEHRRNVQREILAKLQARKRRIRGDDADRLQTLAGRSVDDVVNLLQTGTLDEAAAFFREHEGVATFLDGFKPREGRDLFVSEHEDALVRLEHGYGEGRVRPEDYLEGFGAFIDANKNAIDALMVVTQRPRDLTRAQLKELKIALGQAGFREVALRTAWSDVSNQDVAASIIGFIRQQALGSPLVPYEKRVARAMDAIYASQSWTPPQRKWLERIANQMLAETIVDRASLDEGQFKTEGGGFVRLNRVFDGKLERVLDTLRDEVWRDVG